jgi:alpha-1,6-mannosyltransferase
MSGPMRIVRLANFVTPTSGGLRTALREIGAGYVAAGHDVTLVVPGARTAVRATAQGRVITLPGPPVPGLGGYRVLTGRSRVAALLERLEPDRLEVHDRTTLRWTGRWARRHGVRSLMVSHESLAGLLGLFGPARDTARRVADRWNARTAADFDVVACTTGWAAAEFDRIGTGNLVRVPLGVDLGVFRPDRRNPALRARYARPDEVLLVHCGRLSAEKRPRRSLAALAGLRSAGVPAVLVVAGDGPLREALRAAAARRGLPVRFAGHLGDRGALAALLASADVALAPGPVETFGLAALEALAAGTPVVVSAESALPEVIGDAGVAAPGDGPGYAAAVRTILARPVAARRAAARARAEQFPWPAAVAAFLAAHRPGAVSPPAARRPPGPDRTGTR